MVAPTYPCPSTIILCSVTMRLIYSRPRSENLLGLISCVASCVADVMLRVRLRSRPKKWSPTYIIRLLWTHSPPPPHHSPRNGIQQSFPHSDRPLSRRGKEQHSRDPPYGCNPVSRLTRATSNVADPYTG